MEPLVSFGDMLESLTPHLTKAHHLPLSPLDHPIFDYHKSDKKTCIKFPTFIKPETPLKEWLKSNVFINQSLFIADADVSGKDSITIVADNATIPDGITWKAKHIRIKAALCDIQGRIEADILELYGDRHTIQDLSGVARVINHVGSVPLFNRDVGAFIKNISFMVFDPKDGFHAGLLPDSCTLLNRARAYIDRIEGSVENIGFVWVQKDIHARTLTNANNVICQGQDIFAETLNNYGFLMCAKHISTRDPWANEGIVLSDKQLLLENITHNHGWLACIGAQGHIKASSMENSGVIMAPSLIIETIFGSGSIEADTITVTKKIDGAHMDIKPLRKHAPDLKLICDCVTLPESLTANSVEINTKRDYRATSMNAELIAIASHGSVTVPVGVTIDSDNLTVSSTFGLDIYGCLTADTLDISGNSYTRLRPSGKLQSGQLTMGGEIPYCEGSISADAFILLPGSTFGGAKATVKVTFFHAQHKPGSFEHVILGRSVFGTMLIAASSFINTGKITADSAAFLNCSCIQSNDLDVTGPLDFIGGIYWNRGHKTHAKRLLFKKSSADIGEKSRVETQALIASNSHVTLDKAKVATDIISSQHSQLTGRSTDIKAQSMLLDHSPLDMSSSRIDAKHAELNHVDASLGDTRITSDTIHVSDSTVSARGLKVDATTFAMEKTNAQMDESHINATTTIGLKGAVISSQDMGLDTDTLVAERSSVTAWDHSHLKATDGYIEHTQLDVTVTKGDTWRAKDSSIYKPDIENLDARSCHIDSRARPVPLRVKPQSEFEKRLDDIKVRLDKIGQELQRISLELSNIAKKLEEIGEKLEALKAKLEHREPPPKKPAPPPKIEPKIIKAPPKDLFQEPKWAKDLREEHTKTVKALPEVAPEPATTKHDSFHAKLHDIQQRLDDIGHRLEKIGKELREIGRKLERIERLIHELQAGIVNKHRIECLVKDKTLPLRQEPPRKEQKDFKAELNRISQRLDEIGIKLKQIEKELQEIGHKLEQIERQLHILQERLPKVSQKQEGDRPQELMKKSEEFAPEGWRLDRKTVWLFDTPPHLKALTIDNLYYWPNHGLTAQKGPYDEIATVSYLQSADEISCTFDTPLTLSHAVNLNHKNARLSFLRILLNRGAIDSTGALHLHSKGATDISNQSTVRTQGDLTISEEQGININRSTCAAQNGKLTIDTKEGFSAFVANLSGHTGVHMQGRTNGTLDTHAYVTTESWCHKSWFFGISGSCGHEDTAHFEPSSVTSQNGPIDIVVLEGPLSIIGANCHSPVDTGTLYAKGGVNLTAKTVNVTSSRGGWGLFSSGGSSGSSGVCNYTHLWHRHCKIISAQDTVHMGGARIEAKDGIKLSGKDIVSQGVPIKYAAESHASGFFPTLGALRLASSIKHHMQSIKGEPGRAISNALFAARDAMELANTTLGSGSVVQRLGGIGLGYGEASSSAYGSYYLPDSLETQGELEVEVHDAETGNAEFRAMIEAKSFKTNVGHLKLNGCPQEHHSSYDWESVSVNPAAKSVTIAGGSGSASMTGEVPTYANLGDAVFTHPNPQVTVRNSRVHTKSVNKPVHINQVDVPTIIDRSSENFSMTVGEHSFSVSQAQHDSHIVNGSAHPSSFVTDKGAELLTYTRESVPDSRTESSSSFSAGIAFDGRGIRPISIEINGIGAPLNILHQFRTLRDTLCAKPPAIADIPEGLAGRETTTENTQENVIASRNAARQSTEKSAAQDVAVLDDAFSGPTIIKRMAQDYPLMRRQLAEVNEGNLPITHDLAGSSNKPSRGFFVPSPGPTDGFIDQHAGIVRNPNASFLGRANSAFVCSQADDIARSELSDRMTITAGFSVAAIPFVVEGASALMSSAGTSVLPRVLTGTAPEVGGTAGAATVIQKIISKATLPRVFRQQPKVSVRVQNPVAPSAQRSYSARPVQQQVQSQLWTSWRHYEKVRFNGREYAKIGDRLYTQHAVDMMKPKSLGVAAGPNLSGRNPQTGRTLSPNLVEHIIKTGQKRVEVCDGVPRTIYSLDKAHIVTENDGQIIITVRSVGRNQ